MNIQVVNFTALSEGEEVLTNIVKLQEGHNLEYSMHKNRDKCWIVVSGSGEFV